MKIINKKAFTLIELIVALGLVVAMLAGSGYIFGLAAKSQKTAKAAGNILDELRIVTDQLDRDFSGLQKDMPILVRFERYEKDENGDGVNEVHRLDQIMFFSVGDFASMRQYGDKANSNDFVLTLKGNAARVEYAISREKANLTNDNYSNTRAAKPSERFLTRREHILISDRIVTNELGLFPDIDYSKDLIENRIKLYNSFFNNTDRLEQKWEHENISMREWAQIKCNVDNKIDDASKTENDYAQAIIPACFERFVDTSLQDIKGSTSDNKYARPAQRFQLKLSESVSDFKIQLGYHAENRMFWFPSDDPDMDSNNNDSHFGNSGDYFDSNGQDIFGISFNLDGSAISTYLNKDILIDYKNRFSASASGINCSDNAYKWYNFNDFKLVAIKFTFTIYDPSKEFDSGKIFTHIIKLDN